jgi:hypothetical protein
MTQHNLFSANGKPLNYPHYTIWDKNNVGLVTDPAKKVEVGDIVFVGMPMGMKDDEPTYSYFYTPSTVTKVIEERSARGTHQTDFKPIFQKLQVEPIPQPVK